MIVGEQDDGQHRAGPGDLRDRQRIDGDVGGLVPRAARRHIAHAANHIERDQEQNDAARDLKRAQRDAELLQQEAAADDEQDQHGERGQHRDEGDPALLCGIESCRHSEEDRQDGERIDHDQERDELVQALLPHLRSPESLPKITKFWIDARSASPSFLSKPERRHGPAHHLALRPLHPWRLEPPRIPRSPDRTRGLGRGRRGAAAAAAERLRAGRDRGGQ